MGASTSSNAQLSTTNIITKAVQSCPKIASTNVINWSGATITTPPGCPPGSGVDINQAAVVDAKCVLGNLTNATATAAQNLSAPAQAGLGFSISSNVSETRNNIDNYTNQSCTNQDNSNIVNWNDVNIKSCNLTVTQNATANTSCRINTIQNTLGQVENNLAAHSSGGSVFGDLFNGSIIMKIIGIVIVLILIGDIIFYFIKKSKKNKESSTTIENTEEINDTNDTDDDQTGGFNSQKNKPYIILIIVIFLILIVFMINKSNTNEKQLTENDMNILNQKINEAQRIANLTPQQRSIISPTLHNEKFQQKLIIYPESHEIPQHTNYIYSPPQSDDISDGFDKSENKYYRIGYNYMDEENTLDNFYKPLLY